MALKNARGKFVLTNSKSFDQVFVQNLQIITTSVSTMFCLYILDHNFFSDFGQCVSSNSGIIALALTVF